MYLLQVKGEKLAQNQSVDCSGQHIGYAITFARPIYAEEGEWRQDRVSFHV
jgi:hypothetical protein